MINFKKISGHSYLLKNQNGLNNALYDYFEIENDNNYSKKNIREMLQNYPDHYPCLIIIIDLSFECGRLYVETINIDEIQTELLYFSE